MTNRQFEIASACVLRIISTVMLVECGVVEQVSSDAGQEYSCTAWYRRQVTSRHALLRHKLGGVTTLLWGVVSCHVTPFDIGH